MSNLIEVGKKYSYDPYSIYGGPQNSFASSKLNGNKASYGVLWGCREQFHNHMTHVKHKSFLYKSTKYTAIKDFIRCAESILKLKVRSKVRKTSNSNFIFIDPSPFWTKQKVVYSLFTILVREGDEFSKGKTKKQTLANFWKCIRLSQYNTNESAFERFFDGYTWFVGRPSRYGWMSTFEYNNAVKSLRKKKPRQLK